eukprot:5812122-Heterocapsa_arctica.AAC.1
MLPLSSQVAISRRRGRGSNGPYLSVIAMSQAVATGMVLSGPSQSSPRARLAAEAAARPAYRSVAA